MEVTIENFEEVFPLLEDSIRSANFIALDTEFSGKLAAKLCYEKPCSIQD